MSEQILVNTAAETNSDVENLIPSNILRGRNNKRISIYGVYGEVDRIRNLKRYTNGSGYYGNQVADVARSYHLAVKSGAVDFKYSQQGGVFNNNITNSDGYCVIDCSGFIGLVLRGIDFNNSPFKGATGTANKSFLSSNLATLCNNSEYVWSDSYLDKQVDPSFKDIGVSGYYSIRTAADIAEYYYCQGCSIHEYEVSPTTVPDDLMPGDLLFWAKPSASEGQKSRFKAISHVAVVDRDTSKYYQVTGSEDTKGQTVFNSSLSDKLESLCLIIRPNYIPISKDINSPKGVNLLPKYKFDDCMIDASVEKNGIEFIPSVEGGVIISGNGNPTSGTTFYIYKQDKPIILEPGTYELQGAEAHPSVSISGTSTKWGISLKDIEGNVLYDVNGKRVWDRGKKCTFNVDSTKRVYVYIYISADLSITKEYKFNPSLIRIS